MNRQSLLNRSEGRPNRYKVNWTYTSIWLAVVVVAGVLWVATQNWAAEPEPFNSTTGQFLWDFSQDPGQPQNWDGSGLKDTTWDVTIHNRDVGYWYEMEPMKGHHGPNCEAPPQKLNDHLSNTPANGTHMVDRLEDTVYMCKGHLMTALNATGYGMIYLTPPYMADWSNQEAVISFDSSTIRTSGRDFVDIWITPYEDNLQLVLTEDFPDGSGAPDRSLHAQLDITNGGPWRPAVVRGHERTEFNPPWTYMSVEDAMAKIGAEPDFRRRDTFEVRVRPDRFSMTLISGGQSIVLFDEEINPPLDWTSGVVQFGHHSYNPWKDGNNGPNTWHWDRFQIEPAVPFTIIDGDRRFIDRNNTVINFDQPAPENSHLRFAGIGNSLEYSVDGGKSWKSPSLQKSKASLVVDEHFKSYWSEIPAGVTSVMFRGEKWWGADYHIRDVTIWSQNEATGGNPGGGNPTPTAEVVVTNPPPQPIQPTATVPTGEFETIRINAGFDQPISDQNGTVWNADRNNLGGNIAYHPNTPIIGGEAALYQSERWGSQGYAFPVPNGLYQVDLHFAETYVGITGPGQRIFSADVEGERVENIDPFAETGGRGIPLVKTVQVEVVDGQLDIGLFKQVQETQINGIVIRTGDVSVEPTQVPTQEPTIAPTQEPTVAPTQEPTVAPTEEPTVVPTQEPTVAPTQEPTVVPTAVACGPLEQEAEKGTLNGLFTVEADSNASSGNYVTVKSNNRRDRNSGSHVDFCFNVTQPGSYRLAGIVRSPNSGSNSFFVSVNDSKKRNILWDTKVNNEFSKEYVTHRNSGEVILELPAGNHKVTIHHRENNTQLDMLMLEFAAPVTPIDPTAAPTKEPPVEPTQAPTQEPTVAPTQEPTVAPTEEPTATTPATQFETIRINAGVQQPFIDNNGIDWEADRNNLGGRTANHTNVPINGGEAALYQSERWGSEGYAFPVPNGEYRVELHFAETYVGITGPGQRIFSADVEGQRIENIDPFGETGGLGNPLLKTVVVNVQDGQLDIALIRQVQQTQINGIVVQLADEPVAPTPEPTAVPTEPVTPEPTVAPTEEPTAVPTEEPTAVPTQEPTPEPTQEPPPVPVNPGGGEVCRPFNLGVNLPWLNGGYGADFGTVEEWNQHTYDRNETIKIYENMASVGANDIRWYIFADGRGAPNFNPDGSVAGLDDTMLPAMADALALAHQYDIHVSFTLWDFSMSHSAGRAGVQSSGGHSDIIQDMDKFNSYVENGLMPLLRYPTPDGYTIGDHPAVSFEVINEPEFMITDLEAVGTEEPVSLKEMQRFVALHADIIHNYGDRPVTVGSAAIKWLTDKAIGSVGNIWSDEALTQFAPLGALDYYEVHYYGWMDGDGVTWDYNPFHYTKAELGIDKPLVIGEVSGLDATPELIQQNIDLGYDGLRFWSYSNVDEHGGWDIINGTFSSFNAQSPALSSICYQP